MTKGISFDSSSPSQTIRVEARHIVDALAIDPQVAGDSYVRWAKTRWHGLMDVLNAEHVESLPGAAHPMWTFQVSVCISIHDKNTRAEGVKLLEDLVQDLAKVVLEIWGRYRFDGKIPVMVGALSARAHDLGGGFFNFSLKQQLTMGSK